MTLAERIHENERRERLEIRLKAIEEGKEEGKEEGILQGKIEGRIETIRRMIKLKLDDKIIEAVTGTNQKELEKMKKELNQAN